MNAGQSTWLSSVVCESHLLRMYIMNIHKLYPSAATSGWPFVPQTQQCVDIDIRTWRFVKGDHVNRQPGWDLWPCPLRALLFSWITYYHFTLNVSPFILSRFHFTRDPFTTIHPLHNRKRPPSQVALVLGKVLEQRKSIRGYSPPSILPRWKQISLRVFMHILHSISIVLLPICIAPDHDLGRDFLISNEQLHPVGGGGGWDGNGTTLDAASASEVTWRH